MNLQNNPNHLSFKSLPISSLPLNPTMAAMTSSSISAPRILFSLALLVMAAGLAGAQDRKKYIVYIGNKPHPSVDVVGSHHRLLSEVLGSHEAAKESLFHSYTTTMNAFAAVLTEKEANDLSERDDVISVIPSRTRHLHTTRSWNYLGVPGSSGGAHGTTPSDIIVGVLDSGIDPYHTSFSDSHYPPPRATWKGTCGPFVNFTCNNKIIGAKWFRLDGKVPAGDTQSPLDNSEHGTHVASTIAGGIVPGAGVSGLGAGSARGGVPSARIAVYKVCYVGGECNDEDVLAGFEAAIADGVDVINLSVGEFPGRIFTDTLAIGAFHAMRAGILTVASAGNNGPMRRSVVNYSPWFMTVGAGSIDRQFKTDLKLGNGKTIVGVSINKFETSKTMVPIVYGSEAGFAGKTLSALMCKPQSLDPKLVNGSIVICSATGGAGQSDAAVKAAGGIGLVVEMHTVLDLADEFKIPATVISKIDGKIIKEYKSFGEPVATIEKSHEVNGTAPIVASFSSRGPNPLYSEILKPDLIAPGQNILASIPSHGQLNAPLFGIKSGTSMASPHAAAAALYVKTFRPRWSPAAIRSALMTTAKALDLTNCKDGEYAYGAGEIDPVRAVNPGLVYDASHASYLQFMCSKYPNMTAINILTGSKAFNCGPYARARGYDGLNYPSFNYVVVESKQPSRAVYHRSVKNVGSGPANYTAIVKAPTGVNIVVEPATLTFGRARERLSFKMTLWVAAVRGPPPYLASGSLTWSDGVHSVRSPIAIHYI